MRLLLPIAALSAVIAYQRPDWVRHVNTGWQQASARMGDAATLLGLLPDRGTIAARAKAAEPDRGVALAALDRAAEARQEAAAEPEATAARDRVRALLRTAAATLAGSEAMGELRAMQEARTRLAELREQAAKARILGSDSAEADALAARAAGEVARLTDAFTARLAAIGVEVPRDAAESLAVSVNGDEVVALLATYANVEALEAALRNSVAQAPEKEAVVRRYYGIHATLLAVLETIQGEVLSRIDGVYLPRLEAIDREARELRQDAQARLRAMREPGLRAALEANLRSQELTLRATELYRRYLQDQRTNLVQALDRTRLARGVADNTARTAALALDVAAMVRNADRDVGAVTAVRPPLILPFEGEALRREFEGLSRRLGQQPTS